MSYWEPLVSATSKGARLTYEDITQAIEKDHERTLVDAQRVSEVIERFAVRFPSAFRETLTDEENENLALVISSIQFGLVSHPKDAAKLNRFLNDLDRRKATWDSFQ